MCVHRCVHKHIQTCAKRQVMAAPRPSPFLRGNWRPVTDETPPGGLAARTVEACFAAAHASHAASSTQMVAAIFVVETVWSVYGLMRIRVARVLMRSLSRPRDPEGELPRDLDGAFLRIGPNPVNPERFDGKPRP